MCQAEFPGVYPGDDQRPAQRHDQLHQLKTLLQQSTNYPGTNPARTFASFFRQWVQICSVAIPVQGTYFLQVQTAKKIDGTAAPNGGGSNRFSIRVGLGTNFAATNGLHVYGNQKMGAYANATGANTQFYLTRVLPGEAGKTLVLNFFDTGDASQPGTLAVLPPADSNVTGGVFANCLYTQPPGNATGPPWGTFSSTAAGCKITGRDELGDAELQRPVGDVGDPDPGQLHVQHADRRPGAGRSSSSCTRRAPACPTRRRGPPYILG